jgi:hypothetical protein
VRWLASRLVRLAGSVKLLKIAYGVGLSTCRPLSGVRGSAVPEALTAIASQRTFPANGVGPKSRGAVKTPEVTTTARTVIGPATRLPARGSS